MTEQTYVTPEATPAAAFAQQVERLRAEEGMSGAQIADAIGYSKSAVYKALKEGPSDAIREALAAYVFEREQKALGNGVEVQPSDDPAKVAEKLSKLIAKRDSAESLGNRQEAAAFAAKIASLLMRHELTMSDVAFKDVLEGDPIGSTVYDPAKRSRERKTRRATWARMLAAIVADAHMCKTLSASGSNVIWFVGRKSHREVAEYLFAVLAAFAEEQSLADRKRYWNEMFKRNGHRRGLGGYRESWLAGFNTMIAERFDEMLRQATHGASQTALVRVDQTRAKVAEHLEELGTKTAEVPGQKADNGAGYLDGLEAGKKANLAARAVKAEGAEAAPKALAG